MVQSVILIGHVLVAVLIVVIVLLQRGKGSLAGSGFGAGASATVFGSRGSANFLTRITAVLAVMFFATSLTLAYFAQQRGPATDTLDGSVLEGSQPAETEPGAEPVDPGEPGELPEAPGPVGEPPAGGDSNN